MDTLQHGSSRRRRLLVAASIAAVIGAVGVLVWFQPQKLFIDQSVNEAAPAQPAAGGTTTDAAKTKRGTEPAPSLEGTFFSLDHETSGRALVTTSADGSRFLRFEDLETSNGPDLRVYLSAGERQAYGDDFVDLGGLKGNRGDQNYRIPDGTDLAKYDTAVIWCRRFTVPFGAAELA